MGKKNTKHTPEEKLRHKVSAASDEADEVKLIVGMIIDVERTLSVNEEIKDILYSKADPTFSER